MPESLFLPVVSGRLSFCDAQEPGSHYGAGQVRGQRSGAFWARFWISETLPGGQRSSGAGGPQRGAQDRLGLPRVHVAERRHAEALAGSSLSTSSSRVAGQKSSNAKSQNLLQHTIRSSPRPAWSGQDDSGAQVAGEAARGPT